MYLQVQSDDNFTREIIGEHRLGDQKFELGMICGDRDLFCL